MNVLDFLVCEAVAILGAASFSDIYDYVTDTGVVLDDIGSAERVRRSVHRMAHAGQFRGNADKWEKL